MNIAIVIYVIGWILLLEGGFLLLPLGVAIYYHEAIGMSFLITMIFSLVLGLILISRKPKDNAFFLREGYVSVSLSWIVLSLVGALPFILSGLLTNPMDALFETVSGFTTTGATIFPEVESLPRSILIWRSFTHWIGGMGVLVFLLILLPMTGGSRMNLMKAESPGPSVTRILPKVRSSAKVLYEIYFVLTIAQFLILLLAGMPAFDSLNTTFATAGTGGFGIKNNSIAGYSEAIQIIITVFMILFGINFNAYFLIISKKWKEAFASTEVRAYLGVIAISTLLITINIYSLYSNIGEALRLASFQVASIITTTGFATVDFNTWPLASCTILVMLMFVGACAGSTGGGMKISRFIIMLKSVHKEFQLYLHPRAIKKIQLDGKPVEHEVIRATNIYLITYFMVFSASMLLIALEDHDFLTTFTSVATALNNVGPGLNLVGPVDNFSFFSGFSKFVLIFDMLAGRLELFPLLLLFMRQTWQRF